jgi:hypothetical protein
VETVENILGFREIKKKDWMSEETWTKIQKRKNIKMMLNSSKTRSKKLTLQEEYWVADTDVKKSTRRYTRKWVSEQANKAEEAVREGDIKEFYNIIRKLSKRKYEGMQPRKNKHGALLTNEDNQMRRWQEYFTEILNPTVTEVITTSTPPSSPTDSCYEAEKEKEEKAIERPSYKDKIKKALKSQKMVRTQV